jgi:hypothetical protein
MVTKIFQDLVESIHKDCPMRVVKFLDFQLFGKLPLSDHKMTEEISQLSLDSKMVFVSHRWLRPWKTQEECERNGHVWAGNPHPDDQA